MIMNIRSEWKEQEYTLWRWNKECMILIINEITYLCLWTLEMNERMHDIHIKLEMNDKRMHIWDHGCSFKICYLRKEGWMIKGVGGTFYKVVKIKNKGWMFFRV